ncbi:hypothetical protein SDC9_133864 [bioreactor metagenome]|uniref:Uncharacterized protein n=1 Tax=bioreactor metagenome TaxID=1076179 RepID=A0A645DDX6_9ZZZZ
MRRSQVAGFHFRMDASLEVAVTAQYSRKQDVALFGRFADFRSQRSGVAHASHAAVADDVEAQRFQVRQ